MDEILRAMLASSSSSIMAASAGTGEGRPKIAFSLFRLFFRERKEGMKAGKERKGKGVFCL